MHTFKELVKFDDYCGVWPLFVMFEDTRFKAIIYFWVSSANELYILCKEEVVKPASHKKYSIQRVQLLLAQLIVSFQYSENIFCSSFIRNYIAYSGEGYNVHEVSPIGLP